MTPGHPSNGTQSDRGSVRTDGSSTISTQIVLRLANETGTDVDELPVLYETVNPEALDRLVESDRSRDLSITFEYYDHQITVTKDGEIEIQSL